MNIILYIDKISKIYKNNIKVNDNINIEILSNQITALIGHNGAGKSTLLGQISGLVKSTQGNIKFNDINLGEDINKTRRLVSSMPQFQAPLKGVSMQEAIESIAMIKGLSYTEAKKETTKIIEYFDLEKYKNTSGENLSGGLQRLTSFAMSVVNPSPIVLLDEPTNDVDPIRRTLIWKYMRKLANDGKIVIVVSHNLLEVEKYADRYILLEKGRVVEDVLMISGNKSEVKHLLEIEGLNEVDREQYYVDYGKYDKELKKLILLIDNNQIEKEILKLLELLNENKIISYSLKIANLNDTYGG